jgi:uncharacterized lipoprotein YehR (DUF1307 family)
MLVNYVMTFKDVKVETNTSNDDLLCNESSTFEEIPDEVNVIVTYQDGYNINSVNHDLLSLGLEELKNELGHHVASCVLKDVFQEQGD